MVRANIAAEEAGIPTVGVVVAMFEQLARFVASSYGRPDTRLAIWPTSIDDVSEATIREAAEKVILDPIIEGLTKDGQASGQRMEDTPKEPTEAVHTGTFQQVNDFFYNKGWSDGLPIIPPTREAVEEMLTWTELPPHQEVGILQMANRKATPWNIAVNAVMAGCRPEYFPVLLAAVQAIAEPRYRLKDMGTTGCAKPFFVVNGPIIQQLDLNHGTGLIAPGRRANSTIGRALHLIIRNIAGFKEGITWMGTFGWPGHTFVMAEDEAESPWPPFHTERGFDRNTSTVTASMMMGASTQFMTAGETSQLHLTGITTWMEKTFYASHFWFEPPYKRMTLFMSPPNAQAVARDGYSKEDLKKYILENSKLSVAEINKEFAFTEERVEPWTVHSQAMEGTIPKEWDKGPEEKIPLIESPELLDVFVCGSRGRNRNLIFRTTYCRSTTSEIELPANWEQRLKEAGK